MCMETFTNEKTPTDKQIKSRTWALHGPETWTSRKKENKLLEILEIWCLRVIEQNKVGKYGKEMKTFLGEIHVDYSF